MLRKFLSVVGVVLLGSVFQGCTMPPSNINQNIASNDNVALGLAYLKSGNKVRAKEKLLLALNESPHNPMTLDAMAYFCEQTGNVSRAKRYYKEAYKLAPDNGAVLNNYGIFLCKQHRVHEGEALLIEAAHLQNYINTAKAYENAGFCALMVNDKAKAKEYFTKARAN